jgi:hypothetical protein
MCESAKESLFQPWLEFLYGNVFGRRYLVGGVVGFFVLCVLREHLPLGSSPPG